MSDYVTAGRDLIQTLAKSDRPAGRRARHRFLAEQAERVYAELTDDGRSYLRLEDLAEQAADLLPGLVPAKEELEQERRRPQAEKEGLEADHGIFFGALLRRPGPGAHLTEAMRRPTPRALSLLAGFRSSGLADLGVVQVERKGEVGEVTVANVAVLNAEDDRLVEALEVAVDLVLLHDGIRVGVMRGGPMSHPRYAGRRVFSAGINLTALYRGEITFNGFFMARELGYINKIYRGLSAAEKDWAPNPVEKPWIAAVDSFAIGGGAQTALVFDHVIAEEGAYFTLPALREGIIPGLANLRLPRIAGGRLARQCIFADRRIDAVSTEGHCFCDEVVRAEMMDVSITSAAERLADPAVPANRRVLHRHEEPEEVFRAYLADYAVEQSRRLISPDLITTLERTWISRRRSRN